LVLFKRSTHLKLAKVFFRDGNFIIYFFLIYHSLHSIFSIPPGINLINGDYLNYKGSLMKNYKGLKYSAIFIVVWGLLSALAQNSMGPIMMFVGITLFTFIRFRGKNQDTTAIIVLAGASALMLILEYFIVPPQNTVFYILLVIMSLGTFSTFYYSLKPQNLLSKRVKILSWTGSILFAICLFILTGIILDNLTLSLISGVAVSIIVVAAYLIRRSLPKDDTLPDEFDEEFTNEKPDKYWFKYENGGFPKPASWQGWVCDLILFSSPFVVIIFTKNLETGMVIVFAIIVTFMILLMLKSNYREIMMEHRKDLKK
jgi:hypothetical protein